MRSAESGSVPPPQDVEPLPLARTLHVLTPQSVRFLVAAREFLAHCKRYFNRQRCHRLNDDIADRRIERSAMDGLTKTVFAPLQ